VSLCVFLRHHAVRTQKQGLPKDQHDSYIFAKNDLFLVNNFNHYVSYYRNTYQHGGTLRNDYSVYDFNQNNRIVCGSPLLI
jgi:hypothetical protein